MWIIDAADSQVSLAPFSRDRFSAAAELRGVNWAQLIPAESHGFLRLDLGLALVRMSGGADLR